MDQFTFLISASVIATTGAIVAAAQLLPPLTQDDADAKRMVSSRAVQHQVDERAFCQDTLTGVDCACFSKQASQILKADKPRVKGLSYANKWDLAVTQASAGCR